jgi:hypothetical protein
VLVSAVFAVLLVVVVAVFYLAPRRERCPECGVLRGDAPLCSGCGWVYDGPEDDQEEEGQEPEVIDDWEGR